MHRQSSLADPPRAAERDAVHVTVEEGDALYIPPFYAHHVAALTNLSISVAVWSESEACRRKDALETLPLPFESHWSEADTTVAAALFVRALLVHVHAHVSARPSSAAREMLHRLLGSRYEPLRELPTHEQEGLLPVVGLDVLHATCAALSSSRDAPAEAARVARLRDRVETGARNVAAAVRNVSRVYGVIELALGNCACLYWGRLRMRPCVRACDDRPDTRTVTHIHRAAACPDVEAVAEFVAGRTFIHGFLVMCVLGGWDDSWDTT
jgi:hypothetical protein